MTALVPRIRRHGWVDRLNRDFFDGFFEDFGMPKGLSERTRFTPAFDVSETESEVVVTAEIPGIDQKDIGVHLSKGLLTIEGEKKQETEEKKKHYHAVERHYGRFSRTMQLPSEVDSEKVDATYKDGVLTVTLPKTETAKARKIEVKG